MKKIICITIILLLLTACGRRQDYERDYSAETGYDEIGYVFTISTMSGRAHMMVIEAADNLRRRLASDGINVRF